MKLNSQSNEVLTNSTKESKFTINASAQAFKILSDGLYEHKISAIVRELSCNAHDAHVEAGNTETPFKVILPNNLHPYFEIEDFGIGLDDEGVREVYTSYFTSTKNDSNDAIGAFGLGSKTPFSYTNNFTIRARKDGMERVYSAYLGSDGAPTVNMMYQKVLDDDTITNGVKITVPVKEWDFERFKNEAAFILSFFKTQPVINDPNFEICVPGIAEELEEHGIVARKLGNTKSSLYTSHVYAVMGGVCYRLDEYWIRNSLNNHYLNTIVLGNAWSSNRATLFVSFDIGELEVAASRETLSLDDDTKKMVLDRIGDKVEILKKDDQDKIDAQGHMIKAVKYIYDLYNLGQLTCGMFTYKDISLKSVAGRKLFPNYDVEMLIDAKTHRFNKKRIKRISDIDVNDIADAPTIRAVYYRKGQKKSAMIKHSRANTPNKGDGICLMFNDPVSYKQRARIDKYLGRDDIVWLNIQDLKDEEKLNNPVTTTQKQSSTPLDDCTIRAVSVSYGYGSRVGVQHNSACINLNDGKEYYWSYSYKDCFYTGKSFITHTLFYQCLKLLGKDTNNVVVVHRNLQNQKKIIKNNIPCFSDVVHDALSKNTSAIETAFVKRKTDTQTDRKIDFIREAKPKALIDSIKELDKLIDPKAFKYDFILELRLGLSFYKEFDIDYQAVENTADAYINKLHSMGDKLLEKYPMLSIVSSLDMKMNTDKLIEYIELVDKQND